MAHVQSTGKTRNFPKGGWEARWRDGRSWHGKTFATKREAERHLAQVSVSKDQGTYVDPSRGRARFEVVADEWLNVARSRLRPKTLENYFGALRTHVLPRFGSLSLSAIDSATIQAWITSLGSEKSPEVAASAYKVLRLVLGYAVSPANLIPSNPANRAIKLPAIARKRMHFLTVAEVETLANAFPRPEQGLMVRFAAWTGLRAGEVCALRIRHLTLGESPSVSVEESVAEINGRLVYGSPKTDAGRRTVPLPSFLVSALRAHLGDRILDRDGFVFLSEQGHPWRHSNFMSRFWRRTVLDQPSLPPSLRFHDLRHTCAAILISEGAHPKQIQEWLGHASITITLDRYGKLFPNLGTALAERLDAAYHRALQSSEPPGEVVPLRSL
jgi:integrase